MGIDETINEAFQPIARAMVEFVFFSVPVGEAELPLIVVWLVAGAVYFTWYLRLINPTIVQLASPSAPPAR